MFLRFLAVLPLAIALLISADSGSCLDPYGGCYASTIDKGMGLDPNGASADGGPIMDPNGAQSDGGPGMDPNGYTGCVDPNG